MSDELLPLKDYEIAQVLYGPIGELAYPSYARQKLAERFEGPNATSRDQRKVMWANYNNLVEAMKSADPRLDPVSVTYDFVKSLSDFAKTQLETTPEAGLGIHLKEISIFSERFFLDSKYESRFPNVISTHNARLLAYIVAPLHDLLKFLGSAEAQIIPDHEVITAKFVRTTFLGKKIMLGNIDHTLTAGDVAFIAGVTQDHENIEKEEGRSEFISSPNEIDRAKALFFVADTLTGVIEPYPDTNGFQINLEQLKIRFTDLYFRHIDLVKGKTFRPQWGVFAIKDILVTMGELMNQGLSIMPDNQGRTPKQIILDAALEAIDMTIDANQLRIDQGIEPTFTPNQLSAISEAKSALENMY